MEAAKSKKQLDMLHGPIWNKLPRFALPVAATAILEQLFNASDVAVVGNFTGAERTAAVAAVGANSPIIGLIVNLFIGIALGTNVVIAYAIGQGAEKDVHKAVHTSVLVSLLGGGLVAVLGELIASPLLGMLNVPADVFPLALRYLRIYLAGMPVILLYNFEAAIFRSVGETRIPLAALAASGVLNVALNLFFVAVLHMTVNGVAIATVLSNAVSAALLWRRLRRTDKVIRLEPRQLRMEGKMLLRILRIGLPAGVQSAVFALSNIVVQAAINSLGTVVMAASSAAFNIEVITYDILNLLSGLHHLCGTELRRGGAAPVQKDPGPLPGRGDRHSGGGHRGHPLLRERSAVHLQQRPGGGGDRLHPPDHDYDGSFLQPPLRGDERLSPGLRHFPHPGAADHPGGVRHPGGLDPPGLPPQPDLPHHHDGLSHQPFPHGADGVYRSALLSSRPALFGGKSAGKAVKTPIFWRKIWKAWKRSA